MFKVTILTIGKTKELWLKNALFEYERRLKSEVFFYYKLVKDTSHLIKAIERESSHIVCLDSRAFQESSESFSKKLFSLFEVSKGKICFVIGGDEGLPTDILRRYLSIGLSKLTFTHQMVRLVLTEQIYRAFQIKKNSPYHDVFEREPLFTSIADLK